MMNKLKLFILAFMLTSFTIKAQVSIVNIQVMPYNITPDALLAATIMNSGNVQQVQLVTRLYNFSNELLMTVKSAPFSIKQGLNSAFDGGRKVAATEYASSNQGSYIKTTNGLPSGTFRICVDIMSTQSSDNIQDEFCDEIESNFNQYLYLVYPSDKDVIETKMPMLTWTHSEPFSILSQGESYRMIVTEIKDKQSAEESITINSPLMMKNYLTSHSLQYPYDAKELVEGNHYAWQVQKIANGIITNKTEAWEFSIKKNPEEKELKYVALKQTIDGSFYTAVNGKVYFKFIEEYSSSGNIVAYIKSDKGKELPVLILKDDNEQSETKIKAIGDNRFILDMNKESLKHGFYTLKIKNEKKEMFYLKIYLPQ